MPNMQQYPPGVQNIYADWQRMQGTDPQQAMALEQMLAQYAAMQRQQQQMQQMQARQAAMSGRMTPEERASAMAPIAPQRAQEIRSLYGVGVSQPASPMPPTAGNGLDAFLLQTKGNFLRGAQNATTPTGQMRWPFLPYSQTALPPQPGQYTQPGPYSGQ